MQLNLPVLKINQKAPIEILQLQVLDDIDELLAEVDEAVRRRLEE